MKLLTEMVFPEGAKPWAQGPLMHGTMAAHALMQAINEFRNAPLDSSLTFPTDAINWMEWRADELMREWSEDA